jgi:hypothetical protein
MLYEKASAILNGSPRPRVRVTLKTGEVLETPWSLLAAVSPRECAISTDGQHCRYFKWDLIADFEAITPVTLRRAR